MTTRGPVLSTRRLPRVLAPLLLAALALGACSDDEPTAAPSTTASPTVSDSPSETPSETPTVTETSTPTPTPTPSASPTTATPTPKPTRSSSCAGSKAGPVDTTGMSAAAAATAKKLHAAATTCDAATLVALARADGTGLVGDQPASSVFTTTSSHNYLPLAILLSLPPTASFDGTIQPKVFSEQFAQSDSEWQRVVEAGLVTRANANRMRQNDGGYTGYRVGIAEDGTWTFFTTGR